jgi:hypothetical protein
MAFDCALSVAPEGKYRLRCSWMYAAMDALISCACSSFSFAGLAGEGWPSRGNLSFD